MKTTVDGIKFKGRIPSASEATDFDAAIPVSGKTTGMRGGSPGINPANGGVGRPVGNIHHSQPGSGHVDAESRRSNSTGYGLLGKKGKC